MTKVGVIIPFKGLGIGKSRLRQHMPCAAVDALSRNMLSNVVFAVAAAVPAAPIVLVTRTRQGLLTPRAVSVLETPLMLNEAIEIARLRLLDHGIDRVAVLSADLPWIAAADVSAVLTPSAEVVIAPDTAQRGTNALAFPAAEASFSQFGADSASLHAAEAKRRGLSCEHLRRRALGHDIDTVDQIDGVEAADHAMLASSI